MGTENGHKIKGKLSVNIPTNELKTAPNYAIINYSIAGGQNHVFQ